MPIVTSKKFIASITRSSVLEGLDQDYVGTARAKGMPPLVVHYRHVLRNALVPIITIISIFVLVLMLYVMWRYRRAANPVPSKTSHNTVIEVVWTVVPVLILLAIAVPSIGLLADQYRPAPKDALTVKVTGYQWYWGYEYPDAGIPEFVSNMLTEDQAKANGEPYLLAPDNRLVLPVGRPIKLIITGADVIHSWTIPAFGVKQDGVPGRIAELWFEAEREGVYFGQCSELCGKDHAYMPITVKVVSEEAYEEWLNGAIEEYAGLPQSYDVASN